MSRLGGNFQDLPPYWSDINPSLEVSASPNLLHSVLAYPKNDEILHVLQTA